MKLEQSFEVEASLDLVWHALVDVGHVAPCLPGAAMTGRNPDGSYAGTFTIKIGPTTATYDGTLEMRQIDKTAHTAVMHAQGSDKRGQGGANATITCRLTETGGVTHVEVDTEYHITGRLARFGRGGMIEDISRRTLHEFTQRLQASLTHDNSPPAAPPAQGNEPLAASHAPADESAAHQAAAEEPTTAPAAPPTPPEAPPAATELRPPADTPAPAIATEHRPAPANAPPPPRHVHHHQTEPLDALPLVRSVIADRIPNNPLPFVAGFLLALTLLRRWRR